MSRLSNRRPVPLLVLVGMVAGCGSATTLGTTVLPGLFAGAGSDGTATVDAEVRVNDLEQQLLHVVTDDGRRGVVRWDVQTRVAQGEQTLGAVSLRAGDRVQLRLRRTSDVDIYTDYVLLRQRAPVVQAPPDTSLVELGGLVSGHDAVRGRFELLSGDTAVLVTLPYNPPRDVIDRFAAVKDGDAVRISGRYIGERRFELTRFH